MEVLNNTKLSVNINKLATLRNARGGNNPDVIQYAQKIEQLGAHGITVHPRPDERHIRFNDVYNLKKVLKTEFNIEGYPSDDFIAMVIDVKPHQVTLVPDPPQVLTSNNGWNTIENLEFLKTTIQKFKDAGIRTSLFLNPDTRMVESAYKTGTDRIELYTEDYARKFTLDAELAVLPYKNTANAALELGLEINAGHDLDLQNLAYFSKNIPGLLEVSIGHALICDALEYGISNTVKMYLNALKH